MRFRYHDPGVAGLTPLVAPGTHPVKRLDFAMLRLGAGETYAGQSQEDEVGLVILSGSGTITVQDQAYDDLGGRDSVWDGRATGIYVPRRASFGIAAATPLEVAICRTPAESDHPAQVVRPEQVVVRDVGGDGFRRYVHDILGVTNSLAHQMIIGETYTIAGNWSSFPPHKHDTYTPNVEGQQEELYLYKIRPEQGFGLQLLYTRADSPFDPLDDAFVVHQNDVTIMPHGYHPVSAPPGYDVYYLWFMAGTPRIMLPHDDPDHTWVKTAEPERRSYP